MNATEHERHHTGFIWKEFRGLKHSVFAVFFKYTQQSKPLKDLTAKRIHDRAVG